MRTRDFHNQSLLSIFLSYFRPHMGLFVLDMACALMISCIDLLFPYVSRMCMYELIPESRYKAFFAVIAVLIAARMALWSGSSSSVGELWQYVVP